MSAREVDLVGLHVEANTGSPLVLLREHDSPHRVLPIFIGPAEAASIAVALSGAAAPRPLTHDLVATLVTTLDVHIDSIEVTDVVDGTFMASLNVSGPLGGHHFDSRPSDAIALAVRLGTPLFVSEFVLDQAGVSIVEGLDEIESDDEAAPVQSIDESVAEFRDFLDTILPADFETPDDHA